MTFDNPRGFASRAHNPVLERSGRFIYRRRYAVIVAWAVLVLAILPFAPRAREFLKPGGFTNENFQSVKARRVLQDRLDVSVISVELIFVSREWTAYEPEFIEAVQTALERVESLDGVTGVTTHLGVPERVSDDGHTVRVSVELDLPLDESVPYLDTVIDVIEPGPLDMIVTGGPALYRDISIASESDLRRGEAIAFPLATLALLLVFGTLVAAFTPVAIGGAVVVIGLGAVFFLSMGIDMSIFALNIVTLLGIGIGIDYSLFYTSRFREELRAGLSVEDAVAVTQSLAGRAIMFSAVTSFIGLVSLTAFDIMMLRSVGIGALVVIGSALLAATTLLPALLGVLGHRIDRLRIGPDWAKGRSIWKPLASRVMARPVLVLIPTTIFLVLLALPVKDLRLGTVDATVVPKSLESRQGFDVLREEFGLAVSTVIPVAYTLQGDPLAAENIEYLYAFGRAVEQLDHVESVSSIVNLSPSFGPDQYRVMYSRPEAGYGRPCVEVTAGIGAPRRRAFPGAKSVASVLYRSATPRRRDPRARSGPGSAGLRRWGISQPEGHRRRPLQPFPVGCSVCPGRYLPVPHVPVSVVHPAAQGRFAQRPEHTGQLRRAGVHNPAGAL